ncbi:MAG TPA: hypothetical protein VHZ51_28255 [Ktedonobacteraceae bacterium]|jgi:hypothetical protein|nr:hypothetical protein [Ktedonobacteraceae bacterium]
MSTALKPIQYSQSLPARQVSQATVEARAADKRASAGGVNPGMKRVWPTLGETN